MILILTVGVLTVGSTTFAGETNEVQPPERNERGGRKVFNFEGGNPLEFIVAMDRHFRTRLVQVLTLPETLSRTKVPKLQVAAEDPRDVLKLYNRLQSPTLGQWRYEPTPEAQKESTTNLNVLMLDPDRSVVASKAEQNLTRIKGVPLAGVPFEKWSDLLRDIESAKAHGEDLAKTSGEVLSGSVRIQRESKILIAAGSASYLEMVESLVLAHRTNAELEAKARLAPAAEQVTRTP
jgi:hypothetical protein